MNLHDIPPVRRPLWPTDASDLARLFREELENLPPPTVFTDDRTIGWRTNVRVPDGATVEALYGTPAPTSPVRTGTGFRWWDEGRPFDTTVFGVVRDARDGTTVYRNGEEVVEGGPYTYTHPTTGHTPRILNDIWMFVGRVRAAGFEVTGNARIAYRVTPEEYNELQMIVPPTGFDGANYPVYHARYATMSVMGMTVLPSR